MPPGPTVQLQEVSNIGPRAPLRTPPPAATVPTPPIPRGFSPASRSGREGAHGAEGVPAGVLQRADDQARAVLERQQKPAFGRVVDRDRPPRMRWPPAGTRTQERHPG